MMPGPSRNESGRCKSGKFCPSGIGSTSSGVTITISSEFDLLMFLLVKKLAEQRYVRQARDLAQRFRSLVVQQARNGKALSALQLDFCIHSSGVDKVGTTETGLR